MNNDVFENKLNEIRDLYQKDPQITGKAVNRCIQNIAGEIRYKKQNQMNKIDKYGIGILIAIIALAGFLNPSQYFFYFFGMIFFLSGHFVAIKVKGFGLIFLFSHSVTGMGIMISSFFSLLESSSIKISALLSDLSQNALMYLSGAAFICVVATIVVIIYNLSDRFKALNHSILYALSLYAIGFIMFGLFSKIVYLL